MVASVFSNGRATSWFAAALLSVYMVIMAGATSSIIEASAACSTWPTCDGQLLVPLGDTQLLVAWGHRVIALIAGLFVLGAAITSWRARLPRRIQYVVVIAAVVYPVQMVVGAWLAVAEFGVWLSMFHLVVGMIIFGCLLVGLVWSLDTQLPGLTIPAESSRDQRDAAPVDTTPAREGSSRTHWIARRLRAYVALMKPRLMWLLCLVAAAGMALAAGASLTPRVVIATLAGGVLAIGASGTFNHVFERDIDRAMQRTSSRPIVTNEVPVSHAAVFGVVLTIASVGLFLTINLLAAVLGLAAILYYSIIYTLVLKPNTVQNTVIGGFAGSFPALIGAAAATNTIGLPALLLAAVIFLWTPAHFYNLALAYKSDYAKGGIPMFPVVRGDGETVHHIFWYLGATLIAAAILSLVSDLGVVYAVTTVVFGLVFLWAVIRLYHESTRAAALRSFHASNAFLGAVLVAVLIDTLVI